MIPAIFSEMLRKSGCVAGLPGFGFAALNGWNAVYKIHIIYLFKERYMTADIKQYIRYIF
jgi:hypothetical protein